MAIWTLLGALASRARGGATDVLEAVRTMFSGNLEQRRQVAFSVAMIALSAKMAKADGVVTQDEVQAFGQIFSVPGREARNVARLFNLAKADIAGFETYATKIASLCGSGKPNCRMLEDILDGL